MSSVPIQRTDAQEAEYRAAWLNQNKAQKNWVVLTIEEVAIIRADLSRVTNDWHRLGKLCEEYEHAQVGLKRDLARVTAERDASRILHEQDRENYQCATKAGMAVEEQLRARVAELEAQIERDAWTLSPEMVQSRNDQLAAECAELRATCAELVTDSNAITLAANLAKVSQRNAELVEALEDMVAIYSEEDTDDEFPALRRARAALARHRAKQEAAR